MTDEAMDGTAEIKKATAEANRITRMANAKEKKGRYIVLLQKDAEGFHEVASENEGLRDTADVFQYMEDHELLGTVYGVRFSRYDKDNARRGYTREEQTTIKNV